MLDEGSKISREINQGVEDYKKLFFTDSALWAGSVIESPCPSVCMSVCHSVILSVPSGAVFLERSSSHHNFHTVRARDLKF